MLMIIVYYNVCMLDGDSKKAVATNSNDRTKRNQESENQPQPTSSTS